ncbi:hypothetical protein [Paraburkholderia sp. BL10I2N1]|nr:hypothetical protein [Paraburkholderia sp. BL10I2N1]
MDERALDHVTFEEVGFDLDQALSHVNSLFRRADTELVRQVHT